MTMGMLPNIHLKDRLSVPGRRGFTLVWWAPWGSNPQPAD